MTKPTPIKDQDALVQLERVAAQFEAWRRNKTSRSEKIPEPLLQEAQKLKSYIGSSAVQRRLGLTKAQLEKGMAAPTAKSGGAQAEFVQVVPAQSVASRTELVIDVNLPDGTKISLSGLSQSDPLALLAKILPSPC